jgi:hypothetical protein
MEPIGAASWLGKSRFDGAVPPDPGLDATMDDFRIYDRVLAQTEIADLAWPQHDYSYWRFDETSGLTAKDSSDNTIPTVVMGGATWTTGRVGGALDFPGGAAGSNGPYVYFATNPIANCTTQLTAAVWIKAHDLSHPWTRIFDFGNGTDIGDSFMYLTPSDGGGSVHFAMIAPTGPTDVVTAPNLIVGDDTWHHVAVTVDESGMITIYVDGAVKQQQSSNGAKPGDFATISTNRWLGKSQGAPDAYLNAALDELRISCRAFTADEIKNLATVVP